MWVSLPANKFQVGGLGRMCIPFGSMGESLAHGSLGHVLVIVAR